MKLNSLPLFVSCALVGGITLSLGLSQPPFLERMGLGLYDALQRSFPAEKANQVALVYVDTSSVQALAEEQKVYFPFPRALYAEFISAAKSLQSKGLGFDIVFSEPSARGPEDDQAFVSAIETAGFPVVFASGSQVPVPAEAYQTLKNLGWGNTDIIQSPDGLFRRGSVDTFSFGSRLIRPLFPDFPEHHQGWIHFGRRDDIPQIPFYNVLQSQFDPVLKGNLEPLLKGRVWIVGFSSPGLLDLKPTPVDANSAGPFLQASLIQNLISNQGGVRPLRATGTALVFLGLMMVWHIGLYLLQPRVPSILLLLAFFISIVLPFGVSVLSWWIPRSEPIWVDPVPLIISMLAVTGLYFFVKVRRDWKDRIQFAKTIESSMSPQMLALIEKGEVQVKRYGEKREVCILFADLAGFTTLSEELEPEQLMELMNEYLDDAVHLIISRDGYVDKFIGDAIMALWGAPVSGIADVNHALSAALGFASITEDCRKRWKEKYNLDFPIYTRVGLHFGSVVVGNLGSRDRFNYTALGDSVNLASRLEGVGKYYRQEITVSGELMDRASEEMRALFFCVDVITVKGKDVPTRIYSSRAQYSEGVISQYEHAFSAYQKQEWDDALKALGAITAVAGDASPGVVSLLLERCQKLKLGQGLERFKDGIWSLDEK